MPNKWLNQKGIAIKKPQYKVANWSEYNASLKNRGDVELWQSVIEKALGIEEAPAKKQVLEEKKAA